MLTAVCIVSLIPTLVCPSFYTSAMLQIIFPFALIHCAIYMFVNARAISFIVGPESIVYITVNVNEFTFPMGSIFAPLSGVLCSIRPCLLSKPVSKSALPLASINCARFEFVRRSVISRLVSLVNSLAYRFSCFLLSKVLA
jgi:hypothetical protein